MFMGASTSSHRRGGHPRTTTPLWQVTMDGMNDLAPVRADEAEYTPLGREGEVGLSEHLSIMGNRLLHSRAYNLLYALLIVLNTGALVVAISIPAREQSALMVTLDVAITGSLLVEVVLRMLVQGRQRFWSDGANRFDCFVCGLCVMTLSLYLLEGPSGAEKAEQVFTIIVVVVRYVIQIARLAVFVRSYKRTTSGSTADIVLGEPDDQALDDERDDAAAGLEAGSLYGSGLSLADGADYYKSRAAAPDSPWQ
jgi:hypothetical protein